MHYGSLKTASLNGKKFLTKSTGKPLGCTLTTIKKFQTSHIAFNHLLLSPLELKFYWMNFLPHTLYTNVTTHIHLPVTNVNTPALTFIGQLAHLINY
jgi:hypothetical protein